MSRVTEPLSSHGRKDMGQGEGGRLAPLSFNGGNLEGVTIHLPVASAQVKSCLLLAGLYASGKTIIYEPSRSRDHTERMLKAMGAKIGVKDLRVEITPGRELSPLEIDVPGDPSSAAFWATAAMTLPESAITIKDVGLNTTRTGFF